MSKIDRKRIAYYGRPVDSLTRDELITALEELAGAIHDCAKGKTKCGQIIKIIESTERKGD